MGAFTDIGAKLNDVGQCTPDEALAFFSDLYEISRLACQQLAGKGYENDFPTKQYRGPGGLSPSVNGWRYGGPIGVCDHYTADISLASTLRWFSSHQWKQPDGSMKVGSASAAFVIDLDGTPYCLIDFWRGKADWHEPKLNGICVGIEHVNAGELRQNGNHFTYWPDNWMRNYPLAEKFPPQNVNWRGAHFMQPFSASQMRTNVAIKRALIALYGDKVQPKMFVEHAMYRTDKLDMGPLWPLKFLNEAAFGHQPLKQYNFPGV